MRRDRATFPIRVALSGFGQVGGRREFGGDFGDDRDRGVVVAGSPHEFGAGDVVLERYERDAAASEAVGGAGQPGDADAGRDEAQESLDGGGPLDDVRGEAGGGEVGVVAAVPGFPGAA